MAEPHDDTVSELTQRIAELENEVCTAKDQIPPDMEGASLSEALIRLKDDRARLDAELRQVPKFVLEQVQVNRGNVVLMKYKEKVSLEEARKDYVALRSWFQRENLHVRLLQLSQNLDLACVDEALMNTFGWFKKGGKL